MINIVWLQVTALTTSLKSSSSRTVRVVFSELGDEVLINYHGPKPSSLLVST
jgi:hypothetical protein